MAFARPYFSKKIKLIASNGTLVQHLRVILLGINLQLQFMCILYEHTIQIMLIFSSYLVIMSIVKVKRLHSI